MQVERTSVAFAAIVLCTALPAAAQTVTIEAESMALSSYVAETGGHCGSQEVKAPGSIPEPVRPEADP